MSRSPEPGQKHMSVSWLRLQMLEPQSNMMWWQMRSNRSWANVVIGLRHGWVLPPDWQRGWQPRNRVAAGTQPLPVQHMSCPQPPPDCLGPEQRGCPCCQGAGWQWAHAYRPQAHADACPGSPWSAVSPGLLLYALLPMQAQRSNAAGHHAQLRAASSPRVCAGGDRQPYGAQVRLRHAGHVLPGGHPCAWVLAGLRLVVRGSGGPHGRSWAAGWCRASSESSASRERPSGPVLQGAAPWVGSHRTPCVHPAVADRRRCQSLHVYRLRQVCDPGHAGQPYRLHASPRWKPAGSWSDARLGSCLLQLACCTYLAEPSLYSCLGLRLTLPGWDALHCGCCQAWCRGHLHHGEHDEQEIGAHARRAGHASAVAYGWWGREDQLYGRSSCQDWGGLRPGGSWGATSRAGGHHAGCRHGACLAAQSRCPGWIFQHGHRRLAQTLGGAAGLGPWNAAATRVDACSPCGSLACACIHYRSQCSSWSTETLQVSLHRLLLDSCTVMVFI